MRKLTIVLVLMVVGSVSVGPHPAKPAEIRGLQHANRLPDQYIVVMNWGDLLSQSEASSMVRSVGSDMLFSYGAAIQGFTLRAPERAVRALLKNPRVAYIEAGQEVYLDQLVYPSVA